LEGGDTLGQKIPKPEKRETQRRQSRQGSGKEKEVTFLFPFLKKYRATSVARYSTLIAFSKPLPFL
jgi:hypothetical protein